MAPKAEKKLAEKKLTNGEEERKTVGEKTPIGKAVVAATKEKVTPPAASKAKKKIYKEGGRQEEEEGK